MKRRCFTALLAATPMFALAQTFVWDGGGADDNFGTGQNWNPDGAPGVGSGVVLSFTGATRPTPVNNYAGVTDSFGEWRLAAGAGADFSVSGQILRLHGKIENDAGSGRQFSIGTASIVSADGSMEINPVGGNIVIGATTPIFLDNNASLNVYDGNNGRTLTINGALDNGNGVGGNGSLVLNQTATVVLAGTGNDYGSTTIGAGATLRVGNGAANGSLGQGGVTNNGTLTFNRGAGSSYNQGATVSGTGTFRVQSGTVVGTVAQSFGASGAKLDIQSGGAVNLSGQNRSGVPFDVFASGTGDGGNGVIFNSGAAVYGNSGIRNVTLTGPATFVVGGTGEGNRYDFLSTGTLTLNGNAFTKAGGGNLVVRSTPAAAGGTLNVTAGTLGFEDNFTGANTAAYTINVSANGAYVGAYNGRAIQSNINLSNLGGIYSQGGAVSTWSGTVNLGAGGGQINTGNIVYPGSDITVSGPVTGGTLTVNGGNRVILSNAGNSYTGGTELLGGTLEVPAINRIGTGYLAVKNGATFQWTNAGAESTTRLLWLDSGTSNINVSNATGSLTWNPSGGTRNQTFTKLGAGTLTMGGAFTGGASINVNGGTLVLTGSSSNTGATNIRSGTLVVDGGTLSATSYLGNPNSGTTSVLEIKNNASITSTSGVTFGDQSNAAITINHTGGSLTNTGTTNNPGGNALSNRWGHWGGGATTYNLSGGSLNLTGAPLYLSWDGPATLNISGGTANLAGINMGYSTRTQNSTINLSATGTLNIGASGIVTGGTANKAINLQGGTLGSLATWSSDRPMTLSNTPTVNAGAGHTITLSGALGGTGNLVKDGTGTLLLSGNSNYSGTTSVAAGTLRLGNQNALGTAAGGTTIQNGATLDLNGAYAGVSSTEAFNVQGAGVGGLGAIVNTGAAIVNSGIGSINLTGNTTIGGPNRWDFRSGATFAGNGFTLTKAGTFQMAVTSPLNGADIVINEGRITIQDANALGTGGTTTVNAGATLDYYGAYTVPEALVFNGGTLASENNDTTFSGPVTLNAATPVNTLAGGHDITISGAIGGAGGIVKGGSSTLTLSSGASTYTGPTVVNAGTLVVNSGSEQSLGANPGSFNAGQLRLNNGTLEVSGASLTLNDANRGVSIGTAGTGSGTFNVGSGLTLSLGQALNANTTGTLTKTGAGTFNLTANATINALVVDAGNYEQLGGQTEILTTSTGLEIRSGAQYHLAGGELKTDKINVLSGGTFRWGAGRLKSYSSNGNLGTTDYTGPGYHAIKAGLTTTVAANLDTDAGSVLVMHGSPTLYINNGVLFNNWAVTGDVDLTTAGDTLEFEMNPYFLRPFSSAGVGAIETGSLPLLTWTGSFLGGEFDAVTGINLTQGVGFNQALTPVTDPSALLVDTWYIEYDTAAQTIWFHYKVSGYVPEPGGFGLVALGALGLRTVRVLARKRREVAA